MFDNILNIMEIPTVAIKWNLRGYWKSKRSSQLYQESCAELYFGQGEKEKGFSMETSTILLTEILH